jgi:Fe-S-cluster containining protein
MDDKPPKPGVTAAFALGEIMRRAMLTSYGMIARETLVGLESAASVEAMAELLVAKGVIDAEELATHREAAMHRIAKARAQDSSGPWLTMVPDGDRDQPATIVDCNARHPHCQSACCTFYRVILTEDEVRGGKLLWDLGAPYSLPRAPSGHCAYLDQNTLACTVWRDRPYVCRGYSCAEDKQIWEDFSAMIPTERVRALTRIRRAAKSDE